MFTNNLYVFSTASLGLCSFYLYYAYDMSCHGHICDPPQKKYVKNIMTTDKHWRHYKTEILLKCFIAWSLMWSY